MIVHVGSILHTYTKGRSEIECKGTTLRSVLADLERRHPGARFRVIDEQDRIRTHVRIFIGERPATTLDTPVGRDDAVHILGALSGG